MDYSCVLVFLELARKKESCLILCPNLYSAAALTSFPSINKQAAESA